MTTAVRLREAMTTHDPLFERVSGLRDYLRVAQDVVPEELVAAARTATGHAHQRLGLSGAHTVVALAGATGSGKSSLFNALARIDVSPVGIRRPTTALPYACVWGQAGAWELLEWLEIAPDRRFLRESPLDADDEAPLRGLMLLDLPDFDSIAATHRDEVDRVLALVDLIVWVVDPQKYGDQVIHERYLREFRAYSDITVVAWNQADRLNANDVRRCLDDLRALLDNDGLMNVPVLATSAKVDPPGHGDLRRALEGAVAKRAAARQRLATDVNRAVGVLAPTVGGPVDESAIDGTVVRELARAMSGAAGLPAIVDAGVRAYRHRATRLTGWPFTRLLRPLRPDPLRRLRMADAAAAKRKPKRADAPGGDPREIPRSSAGQASIALAIRAVADRAAAGLPTPWPQAVHRAARAELPEVPDALDRAVALTDLGVRQNPRWWRAVWIMQWLCVYAVLASLGWLLASVVVHRLNRTMPTLPEVRGRPLPLIIIAGGLLVGILVALLVKPLIRAGTGKARTVMRQRLHRAIDDVAEERVVDPIRDVLDRYGQARDALREAAS